MAPFGTKESEKRKNAEIVAKILESKGFDVYKPDYLRFDMWTCIKSYSHSHSLLLFLNLQPWEAPYGCYICTGFSLCMKEKLMHQWIFPVHRSAKCMYRQGKHNLLLHFCFSCNKRDITIIKILKNKNAKRKEKYLCRM